MRDYPKFYFEKRAKPLITTKLCSFSQTEKKKSLEIKEDLKMNSFVLKTVQRFIQCIDEADFDRIHKCVDSVYGFADKPAIMPLIVTVIDKLSKTEKKKYSLNKVIKHIAF